MEIIPQTLGGRTGCRIFGPTMDWTLLVATNFRHSHADHSQADDGLKIFIRSQICCLSYCQAKFVKELNQIKNNLLLGQFLAYRILAQFGTIFYGQVVLINSSSQI